MVIVAKMKKVIERLFNAFENIRFNINEDITWFENSLPQIENCFVFLQKRAMSTRDLVLLFGLFWPNIDRDMEKKEFIQRLTIIIWTNFVFNLSSVEYFLKNIIEATSKGPLAEWLNKKRSNLAKEGKQFRMYLGNIMGISKRKNLITKKQHTSWNGLIHLRNAIVHNNGIFDVNEKLHIGAIEISTETSRPIETMLINYPKFLNTLISLTKDWIEKYLRIHEI